MLLSSAEPFQRTVTTTLATSLHQLKQNATDAIIGGDIESFKKGIPFGVNASLCESLANLGNKIEDDGNLNINFELVSVTSFNLRDRKKNIVATRCFSNFRGGCNLF